MGKQPYKFWNRNQLFQHLKTQLDYYSFMDDDNYTLLKDACYDERWIPMLDFNGCNIVQDDLHPFFPCFIHDWRWITNQDAKEADYELYYNLKKCSVPEFRARIYYLGVRIGWYCYYKWKK